MDRTQQILFARQALEPPQLISRETLWEDVMEIDDSEQEYARIIQDRVLDDPVIQGIAIIEELRAREEFYRSKGNALAADTIKKYIMQLEMSIGMRQGIPTTPGKAGAGISPQIVPPEMVNNPDVRAAAQGKPTTANAGRGGGLLDSQGKPLL